MELGYFERIMSQAFEAKMIHAGLDDLENGRVKEGNAVLAAMEEKYGF